MVVGVELAGGDLYSAAKHEMQALRQGERAHDEAGSDEVLITPGMRSVDIESCVVLHLGPEFPGHIELESVVEHNLPSQQRGATLGNGAAQIRLPIKKLPAFSGREHR